MRRFLLVAIILGPSAALALDNPYCVGAPTPLVLADAIEDHDPRTADSFRARHGTDLDARLAAARRVGGSQPFKGLSIDLAIAGRFDEAYAIGGPLRRLLAGEAADLGADVALRRLPLSKFTKFRDPMVKFGRGEKEIALGVALSGDLPRARSLMADLHGKPWCAKWDAALAGLEGDRAGLDNALAAAAALLPKDGVKETPEEWSDRIACGPDVVVNAWLEAAAAAGHVTAIEDLVADPPDIEGFEGGLQFAFTTLSGYPYRGLIDGRIMAAIVRGLEDRSKFLVNKGWLEPDQIAIKPWPERAQLMSSLIFRSTAGNTMGRAILIRRHFDVFLPPNGVSWNEQTIKIAQRLLQDVEAAGDPQLRARYLEVAGGRLDEAAEWTEAFFLPQVANIQSLMAVTAADIWVEAMRPGRAAARAETPNIVAAFARQIYNVCYDRPFGDWKESP